MSGRASRTIAGIYFMGHLGRGRVRRVPFPRLFTKLNIAGRSVHHLRARRRARHRDLLPVPRRLAVRLIAFLNVNYQLT